MKMKLLNKLWTVTLIACCFSLYGSAQQAISGRVTANGQPVVGASIQVAGTSTAVQTNQDGTYSITAASGSGVLVVSYVGFVTQHVPINNRTVIHVELQEGATEIGEVLVTALGIEREKKALGYSIQEVDLSTVTEARESNIANSLKGKVAGVHVNATTGGAGSSSFVVIRGSSSIAGENQPLYVVDGVPIDNQTLDQAGIFGGKDYGDGINNINPDDVAEMSVLKGPAGAALYGARGANGVILITTKSGRGRKGLGVEFNSNFVMETINVIPTMQDRWGVGYGGTNSFGSMEYEGTSYPAQTGNGDQFGGPLDGQLIMFTYMPEWSPRPYSPQPADNIRDFFDTGKTWTNTIAVSGGGDKNSFRLSVSDMRNTGIIPNNKLQRQTFNLRATSNITDKLFVEGKLNYIRQGGENRQATGITTQNPAYSLYLTPRFVDLNWLKDYKKEDGTMVNWKSGTPYNPYWLVNEFQNDDKRDRVIGMLMGRYAFTSWLSLQARAGTDFYTDVRFDRKGTYSPPAALMPGTVDNATWHVKEENFDVLLTANGDLSEDFKGYFSVGANHLNRKQEVVGLSGENLNIPYVYHISNAQIVRPRNSLSRKQMNSVYFAGQVGYKDYLFLDVTGRNDWSSTLGLNSNSFFYPSIATSFVFTDALGMRNNPILSFGKIRLSVAQAGNDAVPFQTTGGYALDMVGYGPGLPYATLRSQVPLLDLKNELTTGFEAGTELRFFKNRLGIDFTYYTQSTKNQILPVQVSMATGYATRVINAGEIKNHGVELLLNGTPVEVGGFRWDLSLNLSRNRSQVVSLAPNISTHVLIENANGRIEARVGEAYGNIVGFPYLRTDDGRLLLSETGVAQRAAEQVVLGNIQPDFLGGLTSTFNYRGVSLSGLLDIRIGGQVFSFSRYHQHAKGTGVFTNDRENLINDGVILQEDGTYKQSDIVLTPENYYGQRAWGNVGEEMIMDADYLALRELTLGYAFRPGFLKSTPFQHIKLSVVGRNLFYLKRDPLMKEMGITPETAFAPTAAAQGYEVAAMPTTRTFGFNLSFAL
ncbi:SusC/RagA family TonB-linked outer membrane protein [Parapedobacter indicus]|uniref:TonB-linked outer membrane protein, SusC/RagA family n=1 Tax=Parapedobacter indicus TaxID=1477437 RepID=A0A1I3KE31_9SPHI|nr:SusC/RagA family TonB-linked outer membrane protein [Parapedobacter indicus]PPL01795.1 TonB-linked SusC/RagA family outer membrane protein [Parapedobacter indicus]SFI70781.1 TonB-linked outer membrane protein, SusC/RagA family [Parapedobacter indicus]